MDDVDICKRIAEIEGVNYTMGVNRNVYPAQDVLLYHERDDRRERLKKYNPLENDSTTFQLMVKHGIELTPMPSGCWCATVVTTYTIDEQADYRRCTSWLDDNPNKAICLSIIEAHKRGE